MLPLDTPIPTPTGWTTIGELRSGDTIFDERGEPCSVVAVHPIDQSPVSFRITFDDKTTIGACSDHLWLTYDASELKALTRRNDEWRDARKEKRESRAGEKKSEAFRAAIIARNKARSKSSRQSAATGTIRTTQQIADTLLTPRGRRNHAIPVSLPLNTATRDLPVDPYVLGAWLGDGNSRHASITCHDPEILDHIEATGYRISPRAEVGAFGICGTLKAALRKLNLIANKHIPQAYLRASIDQRIALLQGLMDTDGNCTDRGSCEFTTVRPTLRDGVAELLASLGIKAGGSTGRATLNGKDCGEKYRFKFMAPLPAFRLTRKIERQKLTNRRTTQFRYIEKCERIDPVPMRCITVNSPSRLYLAGRQMVPTHNTDLLLGAAITQHEKSIIFRREFKQLEGLRERSSELWGNIGRWNGQKELWRVPYEGRVKRVEFGAVQLPDDVKKYQGRDHDLKGFDEITHFTYSQYRFLSGWNRSANASQRTRIIAAGNPPTDAEGDWVITHWGPWLDPGNPNPALPGELRWFAVLGGKDVEVDGPTPIVVPGERDAVIPKSRTFIRALVQDNPFYMASGYIATLQAMPEPLRSQMLLGDFGAGRQDNEKQVIPTEWVLQAQARWTRDPPGQMDAMGVDVARGGIDKTVLTPRHGIWFGEQHSFPGTSTPDGWAGLQQIMQILPPIGRPMINIDVIGVGSSVFDLCVGQGLNAHAMDARHGTKARDSAGVLGFYNKRAEWWWKLREALDPLHGDDLALPPDRELLADLTSARWEPRSNGILIESKDDIIERIGRSPDKGESLILAHAMPTRLPQTRFL